MAIVTRNLHRPVFIFCSIPLLSPNNNNNIFNKRGFSIYIYIYTSSEVEEFDAIASKFEYSTRS